MEENYISNIDEETDLELINRIKQMELDNETYKHNIKKLKKECLEQKHKIRDLELEIESKGETIKNQNGLIQFYKKYRTEHEENDTQKKLVDYEAKIKSLEESNAIKDKKMEDLKNELSEQSALNEKLVDIITNKEETIKKMERGENNQENNENSNVTKLEEEIENLKNKISDLENENNKITDKYEEKINALNT